MIKHYKDKKLVPADDVSLWAITHKDDTIEDNSWEQWLNEQNILLKRILRKGKKYPIPFNKVLQGK